MKNLFLSSLFLFLTIFSYAQVNIIWEKNLGGGQSETPYDLSINEKGECIIVGKSWSSDGDVGGNHGNGDFWVVKIDQNGQLIWEKNLGGSESEEARSVITNKNGGAVIAGLSSSKNVDLTRNLGSYDYWIVQLNETGSIKWQKSFGGNLSDYARSIQPTIDGGYLVAGYSSSRNGDLSQNSGSTDIWIIKLDAMGNLVWQKSIGGKDMEQALSMEMTPQGDYIIAGLSQSKETKGDYWILKLDKEGGIIWEKKLGGTDHEEVFGITSSADNGCILAGYSKSTDGDLKENYGKEDYWIVKLDANGEIAWKQTLGGSDSDIAIDVEKNPSGGYLVVGSSSSNDGNVKSAEGKKNIGSYWVVSLSEEGELLWETILGGSSYEQAKTIQASNDGHFLIAGMSSSSDGDLGQPNNGKSDFWVLKIKELPKITAVCFEDLNQNGQYDQAEPLLKNMVPHISPEPDYQTETKNLETVFYVYPGTVNFSNEEGQEWQLTNKEEDLTIEVKEDAGIQRVYLGYSKKKIEEEPPPPHEKPEIVEAPVIGKKKSLENITDLQCGETLELSQLRFKPNTAVFLNDEAGNDYLKILVQYLKENQNHKIDLYGHTDFLSNNKQYLLDLSQERVDKVKSYLVKQGVNKNRIVTQAFGGDQPIVTDRASKQRSQNRRVEVHIVCD